MKNSSLLLIFCSVWISLVNGQATLRLKEHMLMHEMRATPFPLNGGEVIDRKVAFMWPLGYKLDSGPALDGIESVVNDKPNPHHVNYRLRISQDSLFRNKVMQVDCHWAFYNADSLYAPGVWYWQYGYVRDNKVEWSPRLRFNLKRKGEAFVPPSFSVALNGIAQTHPRVWVNTQDWDQFREQAKKKQEYAWYLKSAKKVLEKKLVHLAEAIDTSKVAALESEVKKNALLVRESRRIVDREETNIEVLIRTYLLTRDAGYAQSAMSRLEEMITWNENPLLKGDFNESTLLSLSSMAYDSFYDLLSIKQKQLLLEKIKEIGGKFYNRFQNYFEAHIADNHSVQMNLRIFTMAAFATIGDLPEAKEWAEYAYNVWIVRFPGLNNDGGWHNGDSYFHVNLRTLVEVPYFYSQLTGYDFFRDPWYRGSAMYVMFQQPPFSKSGGNGSSHQNVTTPSGTRVGYADALARLTGNSYLTDYVRTIAQQDSAILFKGFMAKPGDLSWFRLQTDKPLPADKKLTDLPLSYVFPNTGLASGMSDWKDYRDNAMFSFRSSPYGSTSHALANQNAFNTFYGGKPLFYSSGHHVSFTDEHSVYSHRSSRAHNLILVDGMGQKIGTEGYGWIPRYYTGERVSYVLGDASNAYGKVESPLWLQRGQVSHLSYSPQNGWDENHLKTFRRHIVQLGGADLLFVYDELEADRPVEWDYLLHTIAEPMTVVQDKQELKITASNEEGLSEAYVFASGPLRVEQTDQFFYPAVNWLRADDKGNFKSYPNHWHLTVRSSKQQVYRYMTIVQTHNKNELTAKPVQRATNEFEVNGWIIQVNLSTEGKPSFWIKNKAGDVQVHYDGATAIQEGIKTIQLVDRLPDLEI